ncbi:MAG: histidinol dehydrogenase [Planctomycetota bacterium]|nr:MAG: histidinol dehydrogenase [Planctomycetota bacterium]
MSTPRLRRLGPDEIATLRREADAAAIEAEARRIVEAVREGGEAALRAHAERLGDLGPDDPLVRTPAEMQLALASLPDERRAALERTAERIRTFAEAQRSAICDVSIPVPGGAAGHRILPLERAGCYAPGGRFPLPSSVLMTGLTARAAGVPTVWVASPRPTLETLAAAALCDADGLLAVGGAQAIAALAFGAGPVPRCDIVVGPGNRWVTAAKRAVAGEVAIDMLAGPSELVVVADASASPARVAADLLAQAEHDPHALPVLLTPSDALADAVDREITRQLATLPTAATAAQAIARGALVVCEDVEHALALAERLAPEHLQLHLEDAPGWLPRCGRYGALFVGEHAAEVLGDYGAGPNHTLPTGGSARAFAGLSVFTFLRARTWLRIDEPARARELYEDAAALARMEGLAAHERAATMRLAALERGERPEDASRP